MKVVWSELSIDYYLYILIQLYERWNTCDTNYSSKRVAYRSSPASCNQTCNEIYNPTAYPDWNQRNNLIQGCNEMCNRNAEQILEFNYSVKNKLNLAGNDAYRSWIDEIENSFQ